MERKGATSFLLLVASNGYMPLLRARFKILSSIILYCTYPSTAFIEKSAEFGADDDNSKVDTYFGVLQVGRCVLVSRWCELVRGTCATLKTS